MLQIDLLTRCTTTLRRVLTLLQTCLFNKNECEIQNQVCRLRYKVSLLVIMKALFNRNYRNEKCGGKTGMTLSFFGRSLEQVA